MLPLRTGNADRRLRAVRRSRPQVDFDAAAHAVAAGNAVRTWSAPASLTSPRCCSVRGRACRHGGTGAPAGGHARSAARRRPVGSGPAHHALREVDRARGAALQRALPRLAVGLSTAALEVTYDVASARPSRTVAAPPSRRVGTQPTPTLPGCSCRCSRRPRRLGPLELAADRRCESCGAVRHGARRRAGAARPAGLRRPGATVRAKPGTVRARPGAGAARRAGARGLGHTLRRPLVIVHDREASRVPWKCCDRRRAPGARWSG